MSDATDPVVYARAQLRRSVARICMHTKDQVGIESRALELLTDFAELYMDRVLERAKDLCEGAGRSECNFSDLKIALAENPYGPKTVRALVDACEAMGDMAGEEEPLEPFPAERPPRPTKVLSAGPRPPMPDAVPPFFPPFPEQFTFARTEVPVVERRDAGRLKRQLVQHTRESKDAFAHLQASSSHAPPPA